MDGKQILLGPRVEDLGSGPAPCLHVDALDPPGSVRIGAQDSAQKRGGFLRLAGAVVGADPDGEIGEWHDPETHLIPLVIQAALGLRESAKIYGTEYPTPDGTCIRDYIHVNDLAGSHIKGLEYLRKRKQSDSFNLGNSRGYSVREVIDTVRRKAGRDFKVIEGERREGDPSVLISDSKKAKEILGWIPRFGNLDTIVETAYNWHKKMAQPP